MITGFFGLWQDDLGSKRSEDVYETDAVRVNGHNHVDYFDDASFVAQKGALFPWTIEKNIALDKEVVQEEIQSALSQVNLNQMDPQHVMRQDNETLSGGETQRIHLARVLYQHNPGFFGRGVFRSRRANDEKNRARLP